VVLPLHFFSLSDSLLFFASTRPQRESGAFISFREKSRGPFLGAFSLPPSSTSFSFLLRDADDAPDSRAGRKKQVSVLFRVYLAIPLFPSPPEILFCFFARSRAGPVALGRVTFFSAQKTFSRRSCLSFFIRPAGIRLERLLSETRSPSFSLSRDTPLRTIARAEHPPCSPADEFSRFL